MKNRLLLSAVLILALGLAACGENSDVPPPKTSDGVENGDPAVENEEEETNPSEVEENALEDDDLGLVTINLMNNNGDSIGTAELSEEDAGVRIKVNATDIPEGQHGFHFHEVGKCDVPDFESAGGHFNPTESSHGLDHEEGPHAGDLPNIEVGKDGTVDEEFLAEQVTLKSGEENSLLREGGTALVIHAEADDGKTQPSGDSGDRIICGVIE